MTQRKIGLMVSLLLLSAAVGCGNTTPEATTSPSAGASSSTVAVPYTGETPSTAAVPSTGETPSTAGTPSTAATTQAGLKKIEGNGVELSVPADFEGGNPSKDLDAIAQKLRPIDPKYEQKINELKENPSDYALLAFDPQSAKSGLPTNIAVTKRQARAKISVEDALSQATKQLPKWYEILEQKVVPLNQYQAGRIVAQAAIPNLAVKQLFYIIKNGDNFWVVTYTSKADNFDQLLPTFEQSARTFSAKS